jgi:hypothetical protein
MGVLVEGPLFWCSCVPSSPSGIILLHLHSFFSTVTMSFCASFSFVVVLLECILVS